MDVKKIGQYIQGKRRELGMTQAQLGDHLGVSDKSVSKWERGICLPDVSLYNSLCELLGISLNEFFAGEDLEEEKVIPQSEKNILGIARAGKRTSGKLKRIIALVSMAAVILAGISIYFIAKEDFFHHNFIRPVALNENQKQLAELMTDIGEEVHVFEFDTTYKECATTLECIVYEKGKEVSREELVGGDWGEGFDGRCHLVISHKRYQDFIIKTSYGGALSQLEYEPEVKLKGVMSAWNALDNEQAIEKGKPIGLVAYYYDEQGMEVSAPSDILEDLSCIEENDITVLFTVTVK